MIMLFNNLLKAFEMYCNFGSSCGWAELSEQCTKGSKRRKQKVYFNGRRIAASGGK